MKSNRLLCSLLLPLLFSSLQSPTYAQDTGIASSASAVHAPLKGKVVKVEVTLDELRDARLSINRVRKATADLYDEVTRQQVTMSYNPNVIGTTVIMTPVARFTGQYLAPRKQWVDEAIAEIGPIIKLFKEDVDAAIEADQNTGVSATGRKQLDPIRDQAFASIKQSFDIYQQLEALTSKGSYDNRRIADTTKSLDKQMKQLDQNLKKAIGILQKEAKSSKKV